MAVGENQTGGWRNEVCTDDRLVAFTWHGAILHAKMVKHRSGHRSHANLPTAMNGCRKLLM